jgi:hypothetical protein
MKAGFRGDALSSQLETHSRCNKETGYEEEYQQEAHANKSKKEAKGDLAFYIGIDLGDKSSDVCVWIRAK